MYYLSPSVYAPNCCPVRVRDREQPSFCHLVDLYGHDIGLVLVVPGLWFIQDFVLQWQFSEPVVPAL